MQSSSVQIWSYDTRTATDELIQQLTQTLTAAEIEKAQRFVQPQHQQRAILTRGLLRKILSLFTKQAAHQIEFTENGFGKPQLTDHSWQFNLSHAGDWIVYAITEKNNIGVDIELVKPTRDFLALAEHFATEEEVQALQQAENRSEHFYRLWTAKEAVIKGLGKGFYADTRTFSVLDQQSLVLTANQQTWHLLRFSIEAGYAGCLATDFIPDDVQFIAMR